MKENRLKSYLYEDFGFPVVLLNVPVREILGEQVLDVDLNKLQKDLLLGLVHKPVPLSGKELRFVRKWLELSCTEFGELFGMTHAAVLKWEGDRSAINPATEKCIRLHILDNINAKDKEFRKAYQEIELAMLARSRKERIAKTPPKIDCRSSTPRSLASGDRKRKICH